MITVNSRKYDGAIRRSWQCRLTEQTVSRLVLVGNFDSDVDHPDLGLVRKGTISYEYYWLNRWYNVFRFHEPSGGLRNYYFNICMPPAFDGEHLDYVDLDIDLLVQPDLSFVVLDREDFEHNAKALGYPAEVIEKTHETLNELVAMVERRELPPELFCNIEPRPA